MWAVRNHLLLSTVTAKRVSHKCDSEDLRGSPRGLPLGSFTAAAFHRYGGRLPASDFLPIPVSLQSTADFPARTIPFGESPISYAGFCQSGKYRERVPCIPLGDKTLVSLPGKKLTRDFIDGFSLLLLLSPPPPVEKNSSISRRNVEVRCNPVCTKRWREEGEGEKILIFTLSSLARLFGEFR